MKYPLENPHEIEDTSDEGIRQSVCNRLRESHIAGEEGIEVVVTEGIVVMTGELDEVEAARVEELVKNTHHVKGYVSQLHPIKI